jgi:hypothetical protein
MSSAHHEARSTHSESRLLQKGRSRRGGRLKGPTLVPTARKAQETRVCV